MGEVGGSVVGSGAVDVGGGGGRIGSGAGIGTGRSGGGTGAGLVRVVAGVSQAGADEVVICSGVV
ncbi:MAG: hypothetical protein ACRDRV_16130 [Pseudonocardiaceae bacterium]